MCSGVISYIDKAVSCILY